MNQTYTLSHRDAQKIIDTIVEKLDADNLGAAVAVCDAHGELIAFLRTDGCPLTSISIAQNKAFTAARERKPSKAVGEASKNEGFPMTNFGDPRFVTWGGGMPIIYNGEVVGAVGVSGLPEAVDMELVAKGVASLEQP